MDEFESGELLTGEAEDSRLRVAFHKESRAMTQAELLHSYENYRSILDSSPS